MERSNLITTLAYLVITAILLGFSYEIPAKTADGGPLGPRFFPQLLLIILFVLNGINLIFSFRKGGANIQTIMTFEPARSKRFLLTVLATLLFGLLFCLVNGYLAIFVFVCVFLWIWETRRVITLVVTPILTTLGVYLLFHELLNVRLPKGFLGHLF